MTKKAGKKTAKKGPRQAKRAAALQQSASVVSAAHAYVPPPPDPAVVQTMDRLAQGNGQAPAFYQDLATRDMAIRALAHSLNTDERKVIVPADEAPNPYMLRRPTGIIELDIDLAGGFPAGGCNFISGPDNSGKTWLMLKVMAYQQRLYGNACRLAYGLSEGAFPFDQAITAGLKIAVPDEILEQWQEWRRLRGVSLYTMQELLSFKEKLGEFYVVRGQTGEEILETLLACIRSNAFSVVGCDSLNGLQPSIEAPKSMDDNEMRAAHATMIGKFFKRYIPITTGLSGTNLTTLIFTQQVRANQERANAPANLQKYIKEWAIAGGWSAKHFKLVDLVLWDGKTLKEGNEDTGRVTIGKMMNWFTEKGKAGTHDNISGDVAFYYPRGVDMIGELMTSGIKRGVLQQFGTRWKVIRPDTKEMLEDFTAPSQKAMRRMLEADFDFELAFRREILEQAGVKCLYQ
jgi:RecA/RadA recombinase